MGMIWLKEITIGFLASLFAMLVMLVLIRLDLAPYTTPPPLAFAAALHLDPWPLQGVIIHYVSGIAAALVFLVLFRRRLTVWNGLWVGVMLWLVLMLVAAPLMGWGVFGTGAAEYDRLPQDPLYLYSMPGFLVVSLVISLLQGGVIGWLSRSWIGGSVRRTRRTPHHHAPVAR